MHSSLSWINIGVRLELQVYLMRLSGITFPSEHLYNLSQFSISENKERDRKGRTVAVGLLRSLLWNFAGFSEPSGQFDEAQIKLKTRIRFAKINGRQSSEQRGPKRFVDAEKLAQFSACGKSAEEARLCNHE